jgi:hypothetical protein
VPMSVSMRSALLAVALSLAGSCASFGQGGGDPPPAARLDPVTAIIEALGTHQVVALGDWHHNLQLHELRLELVRDPRFPDAVDDIVVEFGAAHLQDISDRYVNGDDVSRAELRRVWREAPLAPETAWDGPDTEEFFRTVREMNAKLPKNQRIRVVLGDAGSESMEQEAALIMREVTDRGRRAVIVFGGGHFMRKPLWFQISDPNWMEYVYNHPYSVSTVAHLEAAGVSVFSIHSQPSDDFVAVQPDAASWPTPALAIVAGTVLGLEPFATFNFKDTLLTVPDADGDGFHLEQAAADPARSGLTQEQFDAVLLLGPAEDMVFVEPFGSTQGD